MLIFSMNTYALQSKVLKFASKFLPTWTETVWMGNIANAYMMTTRFVKQTNRLIDSYMSIKQEYNNMNNQIKQLYSYLTNLGNIDPYDMDTWDVALGNAALSLKYDVAEALRSFRKITIVSSVNATENYIAEIKTLDDYRMQYNSNKKVVEEYYINHEYTDLMRSMSESAAAYQDITIDQLEKKLTQKYRDKDETTNEDNREEIQREIDKIENTIMVKQSQSYENINEEDILIEKIIDLIAINMNEIQVINQDITGYEKASAELVESYTKLKNGEMPVTTGKNVSEVDNFSIPLDKYDESDPDKVIVPGTPEGKVSIRSGKRMKISTEDVLAASNAAEFLQLKQVNRRRDLLALIAQTTAMITQLEAFEQQRCEEKSFAHDVGIEKIALEMQEAHRR